MCLPTLPSWFLLISFYGIFFCLYFIFVVAFVISFLLLNLGIVGFSFSGSMRNKVSLYISLFFFICIYCYRLSSKTHVANTRPMGLIRPGTLFLHGGSMELLIPS